MPRAQRRTLSQIGLLDEEVLRRRMRPRSPSPDVKPLLKPFSFINFTRLQNFWPRSANALIHGCVYLNTFVCAAWQLTDSRWSPLDNTNRIRLKQHLFDHWTLSQQGLDQGRWWTYWTSAFSNSNILSCFSDMTNFLCSATTFARVLGPRATFHLAALISSSAVLSAAAVLWRQRSVDPSSLVDFVNGILDGSIDLRRLVSCIHTCGFSPVMISIMTATTCVAPWEPVLPFVQAGFEVPHWAWNVAFLCIGVLQHENLFSIDAIAHDTQVAAFACSAVWGLAYYALFLREYDSKRRSRRY